MTGGLVSSYSRVVSYIIIEQQTGMPFIIIMQVQPADMQSIMHSQQAMIILAHILSPLVQVMVQPMSIISILHMPIVPMLCMQHIMPFIMQHMLIMPPADIMHRFFIISAAVLSSHIIVHFMPSAIFSIFIVQRGIMAPAIEPIIPGIVLVPPPIMGMFIIPGIADMPPVISPLIRVIVSMVKSFVCE